MQTEGAWSEDEDEFAGPVPVPEYSPPPVANFHRTVPAAPKPEEKDEEDEEPEQAAEPVKAVETEPAATDEFVVIAATPPVVPNVFQPPPAPTAPAGAAAEVSGGAGGLAARRQSRRPEGSQIGIQRASLLGRTASEKLRNSVVSNIPVRLVCILFVCSIAHTIRSARFIGAKEVTVFEQGYRDVVLAHVVVDYIATVGPISLFFCFTYLGVFLFEPELLKKQSISVFTWNQAQTPAPPPSCQPITSPPFPSPFDAKSCDPAPPCPHPTPATAL